MTPQETANWMIASSGIYSLSLPLRIVLDDDDDDRPSSEDAIEMAKEFVQAVKDREELLDLVTELYKETGAVRLEQLLKKFGRESDYCKLKGIEPYESDS